MRRPAFLATVLLATASSSALAEDVDGWEIVEHEQRCSMFSVFEDEVTFSVFWEPHTESSYLVLNSDEWDSLRGREGKEVRVDLKLSGRGVEYDEWWDPGAPIVLINDETEGVVAHWESEHQLDFAAAVALADSAAITIDGRSLGRYSLAGTYKAILALRKCGNRILKKGGDPFD